jgi:hypothetical protein
MEVAETRSGKVRALSDYFPHREGAGNNLDLILGAGNNLDLILEAAAAVGQRKAKGYCKRKGG